MVRTIAMKLRGDETRKTLHLFDMPQISIDSKQNNQGYGIQAEDTLWCKQGILTISQLVIVAMKIRSQILQHRYYLMNPTKKQGAAR